MVNPCRHSHHGSTNVLEFSLPFFPDTFSSGLLFWGHATPLKKNTKQFVRKLFPRNIKNLLWLHILDPSVFSLGCHPQAGLHSQPHQPSNQSLSFSFYLVTATHPSFKLTSRNFVNSFLHGCGRTLLCWLLQWPSISTSIQCLLNFADFSPSSAPNPIM